MWAFFFFFTFFPHKLDSWCWQNTDATWYQHRYTIDPQTWSEAETSHQNSYRDRTIILDLTNISNVLIHNHNNVFKEKGLLYAAPLYKLCICIIYLSAYIRPQYVGALTVTWRFVQEYGSIKGSRYPSMMEALQGQEGEIWWNLDNPKHFFFSHLFLSQKHWRENNLDQTKKMNYLICFFFAPYSHMVPLCILTTQPKKLFAFSLWSTIKISVLDLRGKTLLQ